MKVKVLSFLLFLASLPAAFAQSDRARVTWEWDVSSGNGDTPHLVFVARKSSWKNSFSGFGIYPGRYKGDPHLVAAKLEQAFSDGVMTLPEFATRLDQLEELYTEDKTVDLNRLARGLEGPRNYRVTFAHTTRLAPKVGNPNKGTLVITGPNMSESFESSTVDPSQNGIDFFQMAAQLESGLNARVIKLPDLKPMNFYGFESELRLPEVPQGPYRLTFGWTLDTSRSYGSETCFTLSGTQIETTQSYPLDTPFHGRGTKDPYAVALRVERLLNEGKLSLATVKEVVESELEDGTVYDRLEALIPNCRKHLEKKPR